MTGFQILMTLGLDRQPAADVLVDGTVPTWLNTLTHGRKFDEARDIQRIRDAFVILAGRCRAWPAPIDFLEALPRIESDFVQQRIESDASREVGMRHIADLAARLRIEPAKPYMEVDA